MANEMENAVKHVIFCPYLWGEKGVQCVCASLSSSTPPRLSLSILPCLRGPPAAGVWPVRCACPSARKTPGWWCSFGPGSPRRLAAVSPLRGGSWCRGTTSGLPAPPGPGRPGNAPGEGWRCPQMLPCKDQPPGDALVPGIEWHPRTALA